MIEKKCRLIENAKNDPKWNAELNAELCFGDCNHCSFSEKSKLEEVIDGIYDHFEEKELKKARLEFMRHVLDKTLEKTNQELAENNLLDFLTLLQDKDHHQEEFKEGISLFKKNFHDQMEKIVYDVIQGLMEV